MCPKPAEQEVESYESYEGLFDETDTQDSLGDIEIADDLELECEPLPVVEEEVIEEPEVKLESKMSRDLVEEHLIDSVDLESSEPSKVKVTTTKIRHMVLLAFIICLILLGVKTTVGLLKLNKSKQGTLVKPNSESSSITSTVDKSTPSHSSGVLLNEQFAIGEDLYEDLLIVKKLAILDGDNFQTYLTGDTTKGELKVSVPVDLDTYNSIQNGSIVRIRYRYIKIDNKLYASEIRLMEVIQ